MRIGIPKEIKNHEYRVALVPAAVRELVQRGHQVCVQRDAGTAVGLGNDDYEKAGAAMLDNVEEVFATADMIVKVKEPQSAERKMLREGQILFTYLHLAADLPQTQDLMESGATCIAYETVTDDQHRLPLLAPMSQIAGRLSIQAGASCLEKSHGGSGILLAGVPGVEPGKVVIIGAGVVGSNAAKIAVGMGAEVVVLDRSLQVLRGIDQEFGSKVKTVYSSSESLQRFVTDADMVVGGVLIPGAAAPKLVSKEMIKAMRPGSVVVDVAIDQGGCFETSHATSHADPTYIVDDVVHYCVANMPGAVARTSTFALTNATLPYVISLADKGAFAAMSANPHLLNGLNVVLGKITCKSVAANLNFEYIDSRLAVQGLAKTA